MGAVDPGREWAMVCRPLLVPGGYAMLDGSQWVLMSHHNTGMIAQGPCEVQGIIDACMHRVAEGMGGRVCFRGMLCMLVGVEGAYLKPGFGKKQALAYATRVGWFQMGLTVHGATSVIIPPAYGKGGLAWKREVEVSGMSLRQQQNWCHGMLGVWPQDEHEADAFALCHYIQTRVHKHLTIGIKIPSCIQDGIKQLKKGRAANATDS